jgi:hypothetical protein
MSQKPKERFTVDYESTKTEPFPEITVTISDTHLVRKWLEEATKVATDPSKMIPLAIVLVTKGCGKS